jgi:hypothetical protein
MPCQMRLTSEREMTGLRADSGHQGVHIEGGDALDPGFHDHRVKRLIDPPPGLEDRWKEAPWADFWDRQWNVAHLGGEQAGAAAIAVAAAVLGALVALGAERGGNLPFDQLLQAVSHHLRNQLAGAAAIQ